MGLLAGTVLFQGTFARAQDAGERVRRRAAILVTGGTVPREQRTLRVREGDYVEIEWRTDEPLSVHLHGYDLVLALRPEAAQVMTFRAQFTGRFPIERHDAAKGGARGAHRHPVLMYVEVYPQ